MKGFKYDKLKAEVKGGDAWGSYSDLFMVLSFVFLMMYVVASLKSGTNSIQERLEKQKVARENDDLRAQMKAYDTLKDQAIKQESESEQEVYKELMNKLSLLREEAKEEKENLRKQANENEKKEMALNRYQQVVRNIINANMLAKNKLKVREEIIEKKNETIVDLNQEIEEKKKEIKDNNQQISKINRELAKNIADLEKAQKTSKITKEKAFKQIALLKKKSMEQIEKLNEENKQVQIQVAQISQELSQTQKKVVEKESENKKLSEDLEVTENKLEQTVAEHESQIKSLQQSHHARMAKERAAFENKIKNANMTAKEKAKQLEEFNNQVKEKDAAMAKQMASLRNDLEETKQRELAKAGEAEKLSQELASTSKKLENTVGQYEGQIKKIQNAHAAKMAKEKAEFENKIKNANMTAKEKAKQLEEFNNQVKAKDAAMAKQMASLRNDLEETKQRELAKAGEAEKLSQELANTSKKLENTVGQYEGQIKQMQNAHAAKMAKDKAAFEGKLQAANMSAQEKARQLAEFNQQAKEKDAKLGNEIAGLKAGLAEAQARADARAKLSREIAQALKNAGVDADVNPNTGDVTISFGKDFFDSGSAALKPTMAGVLRKFVPKYSESLFKDKKIAEKITSVEIVGFASPTYGGKYVDPLSLDAQDQKAVQYNLDLSFQRAKSIFDYMFDTKKIEYSNQKKLLSLVKVSGRSFFNEGRAPAGVTPGMDMKSFCKQVDCKQAQKVIIKFNMDDKK